MSAVRIATRGSDLALAHLPDANFFHIRRHQRQRRQGRRAYCKSFAHRRRRITQRIQCIGPFAYLRLLAGHFRVTARIVCDRSISIGSQRNAQRRQHRHRRDTHPIKS